MISLKTVDKTMEETKNITYQALLIGISEKTDSRHDDFCSPDEISSKNQKDRQHRNYKKLEKNLGSVKEIIEKKMEPKFLLDPSYSEI